MTFGEIIPHIKKGNFIRRKSWINAHNPNLFMKSDTKCEYFIMLDVETQIIYAKQAMLHCYDLIADDWEFLEK